jgi:hypothetical protein
MYENKKQLNQQQEIIRSKFLKKQLVDDDYFHFSLKLRRSTHKLCKICPVSAEYYYEIFCTNCGTEY